MNYLELADKASEYQLVNGVTRSYGQVIQIDCILALVILFLGIIATVYAGELVNGNFDYSAEYKELAKALR